MYCLHLLLLNFCFLHVYLSHHPFLFLFFFLFVIIYLLRSERVNERFSEMDQLMAEINDLQGDIETITSTTPQPEQEDGSGAESP